jgi:peptide subunit release factor 1 (eRF1)
MTEEGKEKKVNIDFEPFKPINTSLYMCDNKFHTGALSELLESDNKCASPTIAAASAAAAGPDTTHCMPHGCIG